VEASDEWMNALDREAQTRRDIDAEHEKAVEAWAVEMAKYQERIADRKAAHDSWVEAHGRIFSRWTSDIGVLMGDLRKTAPRSINGYPIFFEFSIVHREDWRRIHEAWARESQRRSQIEV
jgi:hypothetical protein